MGLIVSTAMHPEREDQPMPYEWFVGTLLLDSGGLCDQEFNECRQ